MPMGCTAKRRRLEADGGDAGRSNEAMTPAGHTPKDAVPPSREESSAVNGISPEEDDDNSYSFSASDDEKDVDEPALFARPERAIGEFRAAFDHFASPGAVHRDGPLHPRPFADEPERHSRDDAPAEAPLRAARGSPRRSGRAEPSVRGAVTRLRSLRQLHALVRAPPLPLDAATAATAAPRLRAGESALVVLYHGRDSAHDLVHDATEELSQARVFSLDLGALPLKEYEDPAWEHVEQTVEDTTGCGATASLRLADGDQATFPPSLSSQITHCTERVLERVSALLRVDDVLNPNDPARPSASQPERASQPSQPQPSQPQPGRHKRAKREELTLPAMVLWRADGGPADEYTSPPARGCSDGGEGPYGRPLVVKQLTTVDQLHSLSLMAPVYTLEHLLRTIAARALFPSLAGSRTLIYFGASWCPPCMRIVNALPAMMREDMPRNVACTVKADMDLATPIFEFFGVEIIPTFIVLDNERLRAAAGWDALWPPRATPAPETAMETLRDGLRKSELGRIQNSQRLIVRAFIEKNCNELSFDDDF